MKTLYVLTLIMAAPGQPPREFIDPRQFSGEMECLNAFTDIVRGLKANDLIFEGLTIAYTCEPRKVDL